MDRADGCPGKVDKQLDANEQKEANRIQTRDYMYLLSRIELGDLGPCSSLFVFPFSFWPLVRLRCRNDVLLSPPRLVVLIRRIVRLGAKTRLAGMLFQTETMQRRGDQKREREDYDLGTHVLVNLRNRTVTCYPFGTPEQILRIPGSILIPCLVTTWYGYTTI